MTHNLNFCLHEDHNHIVEFHLAVPEKPTPSMISSRLLIFFVEKVFVTIRRKEKKYSWSVINASFSSG